MGSSVFSNMSYALAESSSERSITAVVVEIEQSLHLSRAEYLKDFKGRCINEVYGVKK